MRRNARVLSFADNAAGIAHGKYAVRNKFGYHAARADD